MGRKNASVRHFSKSITGAKAKGVPPAKAIDCAYNRSVSTGNSRKRP